MGVAVMDVCRDLDIRLVVHFHGADAYAAESLKSYGRRYVELFKRAHAVIGVSRHMVAQLESLGAPRNRLKYCPYGVDLGSFNTGDPASAPPHFLAVGRFVEKKAPHLTLLAFRETLKGCPEARLTMVGDGPLLGACRQLVVALQMENAVRFPGFVEHAEVANLMKCSRAFIQHSVRASDGDCEGTPVAVLEAQACGLPVVATRHAGIADVVRDGATGFLVQEYDVAAMGRRILQLAGNAALAVELGAAGRKGIVSEFSMKTSIRRLKSVLNGAR